MDQNKSESKNQNNNIVIPKKLAIVGGLVILVLFITSIFLFFRAAKTWTTGPKAPGMTEVGATRVSGPLIGIEKDGAVYKTSAGSNVVSIQPSDEGVNFENRTNHTVGVFIPALVSNNQIKLSPGETGGFNFSSLRHDPTVCQGNDKCDTFEFLGNIYPARFKGKV